MEKIDHIIADLPSRIRNEYHTKEKLGSGGFGVVMRVVHKKTGNSYAMKIFKTSEHDSAVYKAEIEILEKLTHPNIIKMQDTIYEPHAIFIILEVMKGGDLQKRVQSKPSNRLEEGIVKLYILQTCYALKYLHDNRVTHRDIKPANILLRTKEDDTLVKITDFGISKILSKETLMKTMCGTPVYMAPEVFNDKGYTEKVDVWSLGVTMYYCLCGEFPSLDRQRENVILKSPYFSKLSLECRKIIENCLLVPPKKRPSIDGLLKYEWLKESTVITKVNNLMSEDQDEESTCCSCI